MWIWSKNFNVPGKKSGSTWPFRNRRVWCMSWQYWNHCIGVLILRNPMQSFSKKYCFFVNDDCQMSEYLSILIGQSYIPVVFGLQWQSNGFFYKCWWHCINHWICKCSCLSIRWRKNCSSILSHFESNKSIVSYTALLNHKNSRKFIHVLQDESVFIKMAPWKDAKYLHEIKDFENLEYRSEINLNCVKIGGEWRHVENHTKVSAVQIKLIK